MKPPSFPASQYSFAFSLEEDATEHGFQEVSGLSSEIDMEPVKGGGSQTVHSLREQATHQSLLVKRGAAGAETKLINWCRDTLELGPTSAIEPKTLIVRLKNDTTSDVPTWRVRQAWPVKWQVNRLNGSSAEIAIESIEFAHSGIERAK